MTVHSGGVEIRSRGSRGSRAGDCAFAPIQFPGILAVARLLSSEGQTVVSGVLLMNSASSSRITSASITFAVRGVAADMMKQPICARYLPSLRRPRCHDFRANYPAIQSSFQGVLARPR